jgi:hypothetical protein
MARQYAQVVGVVLLLLGVVGLVLGEQRLADSLNIDIMEDVVHLVTGALLAYVGFAHRDSDVVRNVVGGLGVVFLLVGLIGFIAPTLGGLLPNGLTVVDNLIHLALGIIGIALAWFVGRERLATT